MILESESGVQIINPAKQQIIDRLNALDGVHNSFVILEDETESYIQAGGGPGEFTVEVRIYDSNHEFIHWKAQYQHSNNRNIKTISIAGASVKVQVNQILTIETAEELFADFAEGNFLSPKVTWADITSMFI